MRALLDGLRARGRVKTFVVNASFKEESSSVLLLGLRHTKAPEQTERRFEASIYLETPTGDAVSLDVCSADMALLASRLERALSLASPLAFRTRGRGSSQIGVGHRGARQRGDASPAHEP
jgi:hypothetical protein